MNRKITPPGSRNSASGTNAWSAGTGTPKASADGLREIIAGCLNQDKQKPL